MAIPSLLVGLNAPTYFEPDVFPNSMYRRLHPRHHDPINMHTLGMIANLGPHAHHLMASKPHGSGISMSHMGKDGLEINLDVGLFQPNELSVKVVDGHIVVEGKHEEREDEHGHISRHFVRRYEVPNECNQEKIVSTLSSDGILTVTVPKLSLGDKSNERIIPILPTGPSDLFLQHKNNNNADGKTKEPEK